MEQFLYNVREERRAALEAKEANDPEWRSCFQIISNKMVGADQTATQLGEPILQAQVAASYGVTLFYMELYNASIRYYRYALGLLDYVSDNEVKETLIHRVNECLAAAYRLKKMYAEEQEVLTFLLSIARDMEQIKRYENSLRESEDEEKTHRNESDSTPIAVADASDQCKELPSYEVFMNRQIDDSLTGYLEPMAMYKTYLAYSKSLCENIKHVCIQEEAMGSVGAGKLSVEAMRRQFELLTEQFDRLQHALTKPSKGSAQPPQEWHHLRASIILDWRALWQARRASFQAEGGAAPLRLPINQSLSKFAAIFCSGKAITAPRQQAHPGPPGAPSFGPAWQLLLSETGDVMLGRKVKDQGSGTRSERKESAASPVDAFAMKDEKYFGEKFINKVADDATYEWRPVTWFGRWRAMAGYLGKVRKVACGVQHAVVLLGSGEVRH